MKTIFDFKAFFIFLSRNKLYTAINIFGFSVSLMFVILLVTYTRQEYAVDQFQTNKERIFRLGSESYSCFAPAIGKDLQERYPEIEAYTRLHTSQEVIISGDSKIKAQLLLTDPEFFKIFSYTLSEGDTAQVLKSKNGVVLSEPFARKLFADGPYLGKTITIRGESVPVTDIIRPFGNSHLITPDAMLSFKEWIPVIYGWPNVLKYPYSSASFPLYLLLKPHTDLAAKLTDMKAHFATYYWPYQDGHIKEVRLDPLPELYFADFPLSQLHRIGSKKLINMLFTIAMLILLFAVINYINLSMAQSESRIREMATRRLLGCPRGALFIRLIVESILLCTISFLIALLLARMAEPFFNRVLQTQISVGDLFSAGYLWIGAGAVILLGTLTGVIPAIILTRVRPIAAVRGALKRKGKMTYNKVLIGFQYFITIVLLGCTLTMGRQIDLMLKADLGFDTSNKLVIAASNSSPSQSAGLKNRLMQIPGVEDVALARGVPLFGYNNKSGSLNDKPISVQLFEGDSSYFRIMGFRIRRDNHSHDRQAIWLNETAMQQMELPDSASYCTFLERPIAGVVQDFRFKDLTQSCEATVIMRMADDYWPWMFVVQLANQSPMTIRTIEQVCKEYTGGMPYEATHFEEMLRFMYEKQQRTADILWWFTLIAIVISTLGILAMATYFIRQRSMEIAVRKVFGSTNNEILQRLVFNFVRYVLVAFVLAVPVIWYLMRDWLAQYAYRIPLSWMIFAIAGAAAFLIALITVLGQSWKAANTNPVDSIKR